MQSLTLLESFVRQVRGNVILAMLALPRQRAVPALGAEPPTGTSEQHALARWLFARGSR